MFQSSGCNVDNELGRAKGISSGHGQSLVFEQLR